MTDIEREIALETDAVQNGVADLYESLEYQSATNSKPVKHLLAACLKPVEVAILAKQVALRTSKSRKMPKYGVAMLSLPPGKQALIAIGTMFNATVTSSLSNELASATAVKYEIGQRCRLERLFDLRRGREVDIARQLISRHNSRNAGRRAAELARRFADDNDWSTNFRAYHFGGKLVTLASQFAHFNGRPIFELKMVRETEDGETKTTLKIGLTPAAGDWIAAHGKELAALSTPVYMPMIVPPLPRTSLSDGGYLAIALDLLKRQPSPRGEQLLNKADLTLVRSAVNAMQNTRFRINRRIYQFVRDTGDPRDPLTALRLSIAERLLNEPAIHYPYQLDHRSRVYPVAQLINSQSDDGGRAFLEFADGKPLGERGAYWLSIHLANCYWKKNKVTFDTLRAWVHKHEQEIIAFADNPSRDHRLWREADKPLMFLAACIEWKSYKEQGPGFLSHLVVSMDGTCNGYQHLSAMGRDPIGGRATNLVPGIDPGDIYEEVAKPVRRRIKKDAANPACKDCHYAQQLIGKIGRGLVKTATMTTPYGVTRGRIYKDLLEQDAIKSCKDKKKCAAYLAKVLTECIPEVAVQAGKIMKWLRKIARIIAKANRGMVWTTPAGFPVIHENREPKPVRIMTADGTLVIHVDDPTRKIAISKQVSGIVAHLVHSLDAAHMMLTIDRLLKAGIRHFAMVHDSFGVHAADIDTLNRILREEFVRIYSEPVLQNFLDEQRKANPDLRLPDVPELGDLDIRQVLDSPYFFA